ncbi:SGNH hydrolase-type esterase domain-containing protein [Xylaria venustula]|nr:SGNH hydrolase-type esterase domain-containing protein [Xylaria venustula]
MQVRKMVGRRFFLGFLGGLSIAAAAPSNQHITRNTDSAISKAIDPSLLPKYSPPALNRDITEWFAIGDSFSAGVSADVPGDLLNADCSRFRMAYPNQMNQDPRLPGSPTSRTFVFASCADSNTDVNDQVDSFLPDPKANFPKIEKPQIGTVSLSWDDLGFAETDCNAALAAAHATLDDTNGPFGSKITNSLLTILKKGRTANPSFQLYVVGYVQLWNDTNTQCDTISWAPLYKPPVYLTTSLRQDINSLVLRLNDVTQQVVNDLEKSLSGVYFVNHFEQTFAGHRFCEEESDHTYHRMPIDQRTWIIHHGSPYGDSSIVKGSTAGTFFDVVDSILIPSKDGRSTAEQIKEVNGNLSALNPAYNNVSSMTSALNQLALADAKYEKLPISWARIMHPKGSGYKQVSSAVIDEVRKNSATGAGPTDPGYPQGVYCTGTEVNKFLGRDDLSHKIARFCTDAAAQRDHDHNSGSIVRTYNAGTRYEVLLSIDWPQGLDISENMEANCLNNMTVIMDGCGGNDPNNPLNWKRGGRLGAGWVNYDIIPKVEQSYTPGTCSFHLQEDEGWEGVDGPGTERVFHYFIERVTMKDGANNVIGTLGFAPNGVDPALVSAGDKNPVRFDSNLPDSLVITPEARGNPRDYIQFTIGSQSWTTTTSAGNARCQTGDWSSTWSPANRNMDCYFQC